MFCRNAKGKGNPVSFLQCLVTGVLYSTHVLYLILRLWSSGPSTVDFTDREQLILVHNAVVRSYVCLCLITAGLMHQSLGIALGCYTARLRGGTNKCL